MPPATVPHVHWQHREHHPKKQLAALLGLWGPVWFVHQYQIPLLRQGDIVVVLQDPILAFAAPDRYIPLDSLTRFQLETGVPLAVRRIDYSASEAAEKVDAAPAVVEQKLVAFHHLQLAAAVAASKTVADDMIVVVKSAGVDSVW